MFIKVSIIVKNTGKHRETPVLGSLFNKVAGLKVGNFFKNRLQQRLLPVDIEKFLRIAFL